MSSTTDKTNSLMLVAESLTQILDAKCDRDGWDYFEECFYYITNGEDASLKQAYQEALSRYLPSGKEPADYLFWCIYSGAATRGIELLKLVEQNHQKRLERKEVLVGLSRANSELYRLTRCVRNLLLHQILTTNPDLAPSKETRVYLLANLLLAEPLWEIEAATELVG